MLTRQALVSAVIFASVVAVFISREPAARSTSRRPLPAGAVIAPPVATAAAAPLGPHPHTAVNTTTTPATAVPSSESAALDAAVSPSSPSSDSHAVPPRPTEDAPAWWDADPSDINASHTYPAYLAPLRPTSEDLAVRERYRAARARLSPQEYAVFVAMSPDPLPGWLPTRAEPIVCGADKREFYSGHFSIPPQNIVADVPKKTQDWATVIPGKKSTYVFKSEAEYRADLLRSRFAITRRRYGWATNRNLEIQAAGGVPYFCAVHRIPPTGTLDSLPKDTAYVAAVHLPGVVALCDPHKKAVGYPLITAAADSAGGGGGGGGGSGGGGGGGGSAFNRTVYDRLAKKLLQYTQRYMTTMHTALYFLSATSMRTLPKRVLVVWASHYTIMLTGAINGLRNLGVEVTDVPRRAEVYDGPGCDEAKQKTYAKGWFFFCRTEESANVSRTDIEERLRQRHWDVVIISVTDTLTYHMKSPFTDIPYYRAILASYPRRRVLTLNDADLIRPMTADVAHGMMHRDTVYFKRETHGCTEHWKG